MNEVKWKRAHFLLQFKYTSFLLSERGLKTNLKVTPVLSDVELLMGKLPVFEMSPYWLEKKAGFILQEEV